MRHIRFPFLIVLGAIVLVAAACGGGGSLPGDSIARVGKVTITQDQFNSLMERAKKSYAQSNQPFPKQGTADYDKVKGQAVQFLVQRAEFSQEADKMGITITQKQIDAQLAQIKRQNNISEKAYRQLLKTRGLTQQEVESDVKDQLISQELFKKVTADVTVTNKDVENYYRAHISQYQQPESRTIRHILISVCGPNTPTGTKCRSDAKAKALADQLFDRIKSGESFAALAKKYSGDPGSASQGGKLTITRGTTTAPFDQTAFLLGVGTLSRPLKTEFGYHLIQPLGPVKPARTTPLNAQTRLSIRQQLLQQRKQETMAKWVTKAQKDFDITYADGYKPASTATTGTGTTAPATTAATTTTG